MDDKKLSKLTLVRKLFQVSIEAVVGITILLFVIWAVFGDKISCSLQGGEIREYKPV